MLEFKLKCAKTYNNYKDTRDLLDFDDLLILGYEHLKDLGQRNAHLAFSWIQVDEVQDLNPIQLEIINCLIDKENNPCVVYFGDEQQAIYSFMGAAMESLNILKEKCKPNIHHFGTNYRSPKYLLD
jgi:DNA helicase-2/ATP-dependent DNA helicase PcrA